MRAAAAYIQLSADVQNNPSNIAAGSISPAAPGDSSPGDNENALKIVALQTDDSIQIRKWTISRPRDKHFEQPRNRRPWMIITELWSGR